MRCPFHRVIDHKQCIRRDDPADRAGAVKGVVDSAVRSWAGPSFEIEQKLQDIFRAVAENPVGKETAGNALGNLRQGRIDVDSAGDGGKLHPAAHGDDPFMDQLTGMGADDLTAQELSRRDSKES